MTLAQMIHGFWSTLVNNLTEGPNTAHKKCISLQTVCQVFHTTPQKFMNSSLQATIQIHPLEIMLSTLDLMYF